MACEEARRRTLAATEVEYPLTWFQMEGSSHANGQIQAAWPHLAVVDLLGRQSGQFGVVGAIEVTESGLKVGDCQHGQNCTGKWAVLSNRRILCIFRPSLTGGATRPSRSAAGADI